MERGLLWLPLLAAFFTLAWLGWRSYRAVESYRSWVADFDTGKYDIAAIAALKGSVISWGKPSPRGPQELQSLDLAMVDEIQLVVDGRAIAWPPEEMPSGKRWEIRVLPQEQGIPFSDGQLAIAWYRKLKELIDLGLKQTSL